MADMYLLAILIGLIGVIYMIDTIQMSVRMVSAYFGNSVLGAHLGSVIMLANRVATALSLLLIGYLVDTGVENFRLISIYCIASFFIAVVHFIVFKFNVIDVIHKYSFLFFYKITVPSRARIGRFTFLGLGGKMWYSLILISFVSYVGLLMPSVLASTYPDYRAALMQSGFVINTIATVAYVTLIERRIAIVISAGKEEELDELYDSYINSRILSYFLIGFVVSFFLFFNI